MIAGYYSEHLSALFPIWGHQSAMSAGAALTTWQSLFCILDLSEPCLSVNVSWLMWSAVVAGLQTWSVLLMHSPRPGNAEVMPYWLTAMKGHVSMQALCPLVAKGRRKTICGYWFIWKNISTFKLILLIYNIRDCRGKFMVRYYI